MHGVEVTSQGRAHYGRGAWLDAYRALSDADRAEPLGAQDLDRLATSAYMLGRDDEYLAILGRAHQARVEAGETRAAARNAFWIGMHLLLRDAVAEGSGWIARAQRLVEHEDECAEQGYLLMPRAFQQVFGGRIDAAIELAGRAAAAGARFGDRDLFGLAIHTQGHFLVRAGRIDERLPLLDEAMVAVTTGELSPIASGIVYCGVIMGCREAHEPRRATEWTAALSRWCERQPQMIAFSGRCHVHRGELMQLGGQWEAALKEARLAATRAERGGYRIAVAEAAYLQGEVHRLRGEFVLAEASYEEASHNGREADPGWALLRLAQGRVDVAATAIGRALAAETEVGARTALLPAAVEILLAADDPTGATAACEELEAAARAARASVLGAVAAQARGAVDLAAGRPAEALVALRQARRVWDEVDAPYDAARVRALLAEACSACGDDEAAERERHSARQTFARLGALPDLRHLDASDRHGLTPRELEVLRLVAGGGTNRAIADALVLSERTVDRHVSNIFAKLCVSSRAAATAYAYEHQLLS